MKAVSPSTMRRMDQITIEDYHIPGVVLMENAGREVALAVKNILAGQNHKMTGKIVLFCGKGNNGGDGFVAARHLNNMGFDTIIYLIADPGSIGGDAALNLEIIEKMGLLIKIINGDSDLGEVIDIVKDASIVVDAMFGTGLSGEIRGVAKKIIQLINSFEIPVVAVDVPSGICGETGKVLGNAIKSRQTVTMALPKTGLLLYPGAEYVGELYIADIGMPVKFTESVEAETELIDNKSVCEFFKGYPINAHKGTFGRVFIIAGSIGMTGAAALSGTAAVRSGAGLVTVGVPEGLNDILEVKLTEAMTMPLPETPGHCVGLMALNNALKFSDKCDAVVLGPGLSMEDETQQFVRQFVLKCEVPMVIDADGLNILSQSPKILKETKNPIIITPHPGEMARLLSTTVSKIQADRVAAVKRAAKEFNCVTVLKGARTLIADPKEMLWINPTGNAGMATGGSGDVLSGMIGAFIARGLKPHEAAITAVYLHGLSGDLAANEYGEICLVAQDLIDYLPKAIKNVKVYNNGN